VNWEAGVVGLVPPNVVTVTFTVPAPAGDVATIELAPVTVNELAAVPPKFTPVAPVKLLPAIVTLVPPVVGPLAGEMKVTFGGATP
jgi:hypothetical protein